MIVSHQSLYGVLNPLTLTRGLLQSSRVRLLLIPRPPSGGRKTDRSWKMVGGSRWVQRLCFYMSNTSALIMLPMKTIICTLIVEYEFTHEYTIYSFNF